MKVHIAVVAIVICSWMSAARAGGGAALENILDQLGKQAPPDQVAHLREAIGSSPALEKQLDALVSSGRLAHFAIGDAASQVPRRGPFSAWFQGNTWAFSGDFIAKHGKQRLYDVVQTDDILPDNLVFVLGHLAYEAKTAAAISSEEAAIKEATRAQIAAGNNDMTSVMRQSIALHINNQAAATIQGWDDTVDAAQHENSGRPLSPRQAASLMMNLQYRGVLIKAMQGSVGSKMSIANDGMVEMTPANIAAVASVLGTSPLFDVQ
ncbi:MAG: hypothetical protein RSP_20710 [Rhodanobacter sp.]